MSIIPHPADDDPVWSSVSAEGPAVLSLPELFSPRCSWRTICCPCCQVPGTDSDLPKRLTREVPFLRQPLPNSGACCSRRTPYQVSTCASFNYHALHQPPVCRSHHRAWLGQAEGQRLVRQMSSERLENFAERTLRPTAPDPQDDCRYYSNHGQWVVWTYCKHCCKDEPPLEVCRCLHELKLSAAHHQWWHQTSRGC